MRLLLLYFIGIILTGAAHAAALGAGSDDLDHRRIARKPFPYPAACSHVLNPQSVTIDFQISDERYVLSPRVVKSTNECFNDAALALIRTSVFVPVTDEANRERIYRETISFQPNAHEKSVVRPIFSVQRAPSYPRNCYFRTKGLEIILVRFDVAASGVVENVRIIDSTTPCLERPAQKVVETWRVDMFEDGTMGPRKDVDFEIVYVSERNFKKSKPRKAVMERLNLIVANLREGRVASVSLAELDTLEIELGNSFNFSETVAFYLVRGYARLRAGKDAQAFDDFRFATKIDAYLSLDMPDLSKEWRALQRAHSVRVGTVTIGELQAPAN